MKDDEIINKLLDLYADNIRQERELFKHIAILSSAIIGVFAFSGNQDLSWLSKTGVVGLFIVIIISVILLFFVLTMERIRSVKAQEMVNDVKRLKNEAYLKAGAKLFADKSLLLFFNNLFKGKMTVKDISGMVSIFSQSWKQLVLCDEVILKKKEELNNKKDKRKDIYYRIFSVIGISVFIASLGLIIFDVLRF